MYLDASRRVRSVWIQSKRRFCEYWGFNSRPWDLGSQFATEHDALSPGSSICYSQNTSDSPRLCIHPTAGKYSSESQVCPRSWPRDLSFLHQSHLSAQTKHHQRTVTMIGSLSPVMTWQLKGLYYPASTTNWRGRPTHVAFPHSRSFAVRDGEKMSLSRNDCGPLLITNSLGLSLLFISGGSDTTSSLARSHRV
jgi:hypothetical protein